MTIISHNLKLKNDYLKIIKKAPHPLRVEGIPIPEGRGLIESD
jgi:hypothetical protein